MFASLLDEGRVQAMRGQFDSCIQTLSEHLNSDFYHDEALFMIGSALIELGKNGLGAVITNAAIDARKARTGKAFPEALLNLGNAYKRERQNEMAGRVWTEALNHETLPKERAKIYCNLAGLHVNEGSPVKAIEYADLALREDPNNHGAHCNRGAASLELGRWAEGWRGWEHTYASGDRTKRVYGVPEWDGTPGQTVIVWGDQGIGDELFFAQALGDMQRVCKRVILDCHPRLDALFKRSFPGITVHGTRKHLSELPWLDGCDADAAFALGDLFTRFRNADAEWGDGAAYLKALPMAVPRGGPMRIGVSWSGGTKRTRADLRTLPLEQLELVLQARPDAQWFSLQYTPDAARAVCALEEVTGIRISHFPGWVETYDYDKTASFVSSLDLVISVPTTVHHLAGGLGIPNWVLTPSRPDWRAQLTGERLPWYASSRMFRQEHDGDWRDPVNRVAQALAAWGQDERAAAC